MQNSPPGEPEPEVSEQPLAEETADKVEPLEVEKAKPLPEVISKDLIKNMTPRG